MSRFKSGMSTVFSLLLVAGVPPETWAQSDDVVQAYSNRLVLQRDRGEITWLEWRRRVNEANRRISDSNPIREEFYAYTEYVAAEVDARRVSPEQANYLIAKARSDAQARLRGQVMEILPFAIQQQQQEEAARRRAFKPYTPPPAYNTNCTSDTFGNTNCTTRQQ